MVKIIDRLKVNLADFDAMHFGPSGIRHGRKTRTLRIPQLQGRIWNADENTRGDFIAVVNRAFATRYLSSSNAVGRSYAFPVSHLKITTRSPLPKAPPRVKSSASAAAMRATTASIAPSSPPSTFRTGFSHNVDFTQNDFTQSEHREVT